MIKITSRSSAGKGGGFDVKAMVDVQYPPANMNCDYSCNIAMRLGKAIETNPVALAKTLVVALQKQKPLRAFCSRIEAINGFINFSVSDAALLERAKEFASPKGKVFARVPRPKAKKYLVEFISANPTGPMHMGNARGSFLGETLSRILRAVGHSVKTEFYINDARNSKQIQELGKTALGKSQSYLTPWLARLIHELDQRGAFTEAEGLMRTTAGTHAQPGASTHAFAEAGYTLAREVSAHNKAFIESRLGIHFDRWFSEQALYESEAIEKTLETLKKKGLVYEKDGAQWVATSKFGDEEDRVLVRSDGAETYFLADIAYHLDKFKRGFDVLVDIWGADHQGHVKRLHAILQAFGKGPAETHIIITQIVRLVENGEIAKMSKRAGMYVTLEELVGEVGLDVARFFFLMRSTNTHIDFDLELPKEKSDKNPVYYIQYAYVRVSSILKRAADEFGRAAGTKKTPKSAALSPQERNLLTRIIRFPEIVSDIAGSFQAHQLTTYLADLTRDFHSFYEVSPVMQEKDAALRGARIRICAATRRVMGEALDLLGVSKPEKM